MLHNINKVCRIGTLDDNGRAIDIFVKIEFKAGKLSITGVEGPMRKGNARGSCGQIIMGFREYDARGYKSLSDITPAAGWDHSAIKALFDIWDKYHLNDLQAGCEHQRAEKWDERPIDPTKPTTAYGKFFPGQSSNTWNMLAWVRPSEHPEGLLTKPCPVCGYEYGTAWLKMDIPASVHRRLYAFPNTDKQPAWI